jgi:hypothetical protein
MAAFAMRLFLPTPRETNLLLLLGCAAFGGSLYLRYLAIESPAVEAACAAASPRAICLLRRLAIELSDLELFGGVALAGAILHLVRPRIVPFAIALVAAIAGLVLYNTGVAALAAALLAVSPARPVRASTQAPGSARSPQTRAPASSKATR